MGAGGLCGLGIIAVLGAAAFCDCEFCEKKDDWKIESEARNGIAMNKSK